MIIMGVHLNAYSTQYYFLIKVLSANSGGQEFGRPTKDGKFSGLRTINTRNWIGVEFMIRRYDYNDYSFQKGNSGWQNSVIAEQAAAVFSTLLDRDLKVLN